jgi:Tfp pilus assembly protein PilF
MLNRISTYLPFFLAFIILFAVISTACNRGEKLPDKNSAEYRDAVRAFYVGLAALQAGADARAEEQLTQVTKLAPGEPAPWANLGLLALRQKEFDSAAQKLEKANSLAPENGPIVALRGMLESSRGRSTEAISYLRKAISLDTQDLKAVYSLAQEIERLGGDNSEAETQGLFEKILETQPDNLAVLLEVTRLAAKRGDTDTLRRTVAQIAANTASWPAEAREPLNALQTAATGSDPRAVGTRVAFLRNVLVRVPEYRNSLALVKLPTGEIGVPFLRFLKLPSPSPLPASPDESITFEATPETAINAAGWTWAGHIFPDGETAPIQLVANASQVQLTGSSAINFPAGASATPPSANGVLALDFNYDFKTDLVVAGAGGVRLFKQQQPGFTDVTALTKLPATVTGLSCSGVWAADVEMDGDLDIVLAPVDGSPLVLRNNGDGTFKELKPFEGASQIRGFAWADIDADGDPDAVLLNAQGGLQFFANERGGLFRARPAPQGLQPVAAINVIDVNGDGVFDLMALQSNGTILRISDKNEGRDWDTVEMLQSAEQVPVGDIRLLVADIDNNGSIDMIVAGATNAEIWLSDAQGGFNRLAFSVGARIFSTADFTNDGRLDLVGISADGKAVRFVSRGTKNYQWQTIRPRAATATGDQRINSFGIGGEMEIRSGLLFQKQIIREPVVHFGLGEKTESDVARIIWPNGAVQAEFALKSNQAVLAEQRLKGSCPMLFAYDGTGMRFVKDCVPWSPAIGLRINLQQTASISQTEEWMKIRGDQLVAKDGFYDLRITAELWETFYIDHYSLLVVDHPVGTDIFADERTATPAPKLAVYTMATPHPFTRVQDDLGQDVTEVVRALDGQYLDTFGRGQYQGVTREHHVEIEMDEAAPQTGPLWLIAHGWMHPTDASVNIALSQNSQAPPHGLILEVADGKGGWVVARDSLGFPAGKNKTILVDLNNVFRPGAPRRFRLRTNMEIYWDKLEWSTELPSTQIKTERLSAETAELRYRGFSVFNQANPSSPELPNYDRIATTMQRWRDLTGYYTRHGDVRELIGQVDDRIVIQNAGDEMVLRFAALPPPSQGWVRDFVLIGNGWIKDGDFNSVFSKTVLPLPARDLAEYTSLPERLEDDPVYRRHAQDWQEYHTRYVTTEGFRNALKPGK